MKHRILALLCALILTLSAVPAAGALRGDDLRAADTLATLHMVQGNQYGDYALSAPATRAHAAVLLTRLSGLDPKKAPAAGYQDLPAWAAKEIDLITQQGWFHNTVPYFSPESHVSAEDWCAALLLLSGYTREDFAREGAALFAQHIGLTSRRCVEPVTRGQLFETALEALVFPGKSGTPLIHRLVNSGAVPRSTASALGLLDRQLTVRQAADRHMAAVFSLTCFEKRSPGKDASPDSMASGFFITSDGVAVTNYHSIAGSRYAVAALSTGETYPVESVLWYDVDMDLALIRVSRTSLDEKPASSFACMELGSTRNVRAGDTVYTIGNPLGLGLSVSQGVVGDPKRDVPGYSLPCIVNTADISHGSSGGALMDAYGLVIGVTAGAYVHANSLYLAVPVDKLLEQDLTVQGQTLAEVCEAEADKD